MNQSLILAEDDMSQEHFSLLPYCKGPSEIVPEVIAEDSVHEQFSKHVTLAEDELRVLPVGLGSSDSVSKRVCTQANINAQAGTWLRT